jgi:neural cell adhesion molecule
VLLNRKIKLICFFFTVLPEITHSLPEIEVIEGEEARLSCRSSGVPSPNYYWLNGGRNNLSSVGGYVVDHVTGELIISRVRSPEDSGEFTCVSQNAAGQAERRTRILIVTRPRIMNFRNVSYAQGNIATLLCEASGRPAPSLSIRKEGQSVAVAHNGRHVLQEAHSEDQSSLRLDISNLQREDDGIYYCIASNKAAEVNSVGHLQVEFAPDLSRTPLSVRTWSHRPVNISCVVNAIPNATVSWYYRSQPLQEDAHYSIYSPTTEDVNGAHTLVVRPTSTRPLQSLLGVYVCTATNRYGSKHTAIDLSEARRPPSPSTSEIVDQSPTAIRIRFGQPLSDGGLPLRRLHVRYREKADQTTRSYDWPADLTQHLYVLEGLRPRAIYRISFAFENDVGLGDFSEEYQKQMPFERPPDPPRLPADLLDLQRPIQSIYADRFDVRWTAPSDNGRPIDAYIIKWYSTVRTALDTWHRVGDIREITLGGSDQLIGHLYSLSPNTTYKVELFARNSEGHSLPAQFVFRSGSRWSSTSAVFQQPFELLHSHLGAVLYVGGAALLLALIIADIVLCVRYDYGVCHFLSKRVCVARTHPSKPKTPDTANTG